MKTNKTILSVFILSIILFASCTKEGPVGPAGNDGNANVRTKTVTSSSWFYTDPSWELFLSYGYITDEIINSGAVLVYALVDGNMIPLPSTFYLDPTYSSTCNFEAYQGGVRLIWTDSDLIQPDNPGEIKVKIVVISSEGLIKHPNLDLTSYEEVSNAFKVD